MSIMNRKKFISIIPLVTMLTFILLTGCGGKSSPTAAETSSPESARPSSETASPAPEAKTDLDGKIVFWSMWSSSEPQAKVINKAVDEFKAANPKVDVEVKFVGRDIRKLIKPALDGGQQVDIWEEEPYGQISSLKEYVYKLDDLLKQPAIGMQEKTVKDSILSIFMNWTKDAAKVAGLEEGYYAVPEQPFAVLFFYNKEAYEKAGITAVPRTWKEFMAACESLKKSGVAAVTFDDAYRDLFAGGYLASAMGSAWVDELVKDKTGEMWKDPIVLQFAKDMLEMHDKGYFSEKIAGSKYPAAQQDLVLGKSATYLNGTWLPNEVANTAGPDFKWGSFQFPVVPNGNGKGGQQELTFGAQGLLINKKSKNVPAAFELIKYLVSKKTQEAMVSDAMAIPVTVDTTWPATLAEAAVALNTAEFNMPWGSGIDNGGDFSTGTVVPVFMELVTGKITAEEYVAKMSAAAKKFYAGN